MKPIKLKVLEAFIDGVELGSIDVADKTGLSKGLLKNKLANLI